jgi:hypothetical protein
LLASPAEETPLPGGRRRSNIRTELGVFSVHADTSANPCDRAGLERMLRYAARPAFAQKRLTLLPSGKICYRLRRPYSYYLSGGAKRSRSRARRLSSPTRLSHPTAQAKPDPFLRPSGLASPRPTQARSPVSWPRKQCAGGWPRQQHGHGGACAQWRQSRRPRRGAKRGASHRLGQTLGSRFRH